MGNGELMISPNDAITQVHKAHIIAICFLEYIREIISPPICPLEMTPLRMWKLIDSHQNNITLETSVSYIPVLIYISRTIMTTMKQIPRVERYSLPKK